MHLDESRVVRARTRDCWEASAETWASLARAGYDVYRDWLNTPAFFSMLPDVEGLYGLDIGCGEGHNTRLLAQRGARITAIDLSPTFLHYASQAETASILYGVADAIALPFDDATFDFACAFMSLMDIPEPELALREAFRVLKRRGFLQFSIAHPCFDTPHRRNLRDHMGRTYAIEIGDYFHNQHGEISEWIFGSAPPEVKVGLPKFRIPRFTRTLSQWLNTLLEIGFVIERVEEPRPTDETVRACHHLQDAQVVAYFLHLRVRKPAI